MGFFKQLKDLKATVAAAPEMIEQAQQLGANAQAMAQAQQAAALQQPTQQPTGAAGGPSGPDFEPIAGVSLELYVEISKGLAAFNYDQTQAPALAAARGISPESWSAAVEGWNARMRSNRAVGQRFNALYMGR